MEERHRRQSEELHPTRQVRGNPITQKLCIKCRKWKDRQGPEKGFGDHETSSDGLQSICYTCKNVANNKARDRNPFVRIRHHVGTRCLTQLGDLAPENFTRDLQKWLGYRISLLVRYLEWDLRRREGPRRRLKDALEEGYHVDHLKPLSLFKVVVEEWDGTRRVDWNEFRRCWAIGNLSAIPGKENLKKGAKYNEQ